MAKFPRSLASKSLAAVAMTAAALATVLSQACASSQRPSLPTAAASAAPVSLGPVLDFSFQALDQSVVSTSTVHGRSTVIIFISSYDMACHAQARFLIGFARNHTPRINGVAVILEPKESAPLVQAFVETLDIRFPAVHVEPRALVGGPFDSVQVVPHVVVLDRDGHAVWNKQGLMDEKQLAAVLRPLE